jgi:hypothetical protein
MFEKSNYEKLINILKEIIFISILFHLFYISLFLEQHLFSILIDLFVIISLKSTHFKKFPKR